VFSIPNVSVPIRVGAVVAMLLGVTYWQLNSINSSGERWAQSWLAIREGGRASSDSAIAPTLQAGSPVLTRLRQQLAAARARQEYHAHLTSFFFSRYNTALTLVLASGLLAGAMLLLVTKEGWDGANSYAKATFIVATAVVTFAGVFSKAYKQDANAARNALLYTSYDNLQNRILSFMAAGPKERKDSVTGPVAFVDSVDSALASLNDLAIGFDQSAIPDLQTVFQKVGVPSPTK
jgi:hypothetical protein